MGYIIGIDGGGTKTRAVFLDVHQLSTSEQAKTIAGEGTNPHVYGFQEAGDRVAQLIQKGMDKYSINPKDIAGVGLGIAGIGRKEDKEKFHTVMKQIFFTLNFSENCNIFVGSDGEIALKGALPPGINSGVLVIAGTGSHGFGMDEHGKVHRCGGWGHILGDEGGAYYTSLKALSSITKAADGRGPETLLTSLLLDQLQLDEVDQLVPYIYSQPQDKQTIAQMARIVIKASQANDSVARKILTEAADELVNHVQGIFNQSRHYHPSTIVTIAGSMFEHSAIMKAHFINRLKERKLGVFQNPYAEPEYGAALLVKSISEVKKGG